MFKIMVLGACSLMLLFSGCASVAVYPAYKDTVKISISAKAPSIYSETAMGAKVLTDSQVVVTNPEDGEPVSLSGGLVGAFTILTIEEMQKEGRCSPEILKQNFTVKFDSEFKEIFQRNTSQQPYASKYKFSITKSEKLEDIKLTPSAWLNIKPEPIILKNRFRSGILLNFAIKAEFIDASGKARCKWYLSRGDIRAMSGKGEGWTDNNAALFKTAASRAFDRLSQVILQDIDGARYSITENDPRPKIQWQPFDERSPTTTRLLYEQPDYFVVFGAGGFNAIPGAGVLVMIVDRSLEPIVSRPGQ